MRDSKPINASQLAHIKFEFGQHGLLWSWRGEVGEDPVGDLGAEHGFAAGYSTDRGDEFGLLSAFEYVATRRHVDRIAAAARGVRLASYASEPKNGIAAHSGSAMSTASAASPTSPLCRLAGRLGLPRADVV
jgi:hypothetical protein